MVINNNVMRKDFENHESSDRPLWNKKLVWENIEAKIHEDDGKPFVFLWFKLAAACAIVILGLWFFGDPSFKTKSESIVQKAHKEVIGYKIDTVSTIVVETKYVLQKHIVRDTIKSDPEIVVIHDTINQIEDVFAEQIIATPKENPDNKPAFEESTQIKYAFNEPIGEYFPRTKIKFKFLNKENSSGGNQSKDVFIVLSR